MTAPEATPLALVSGAVAGDDLPSVAQTAAVAMGLPVVIALPSLGRPMVWPPEALSTEQLAAVEAQARAAVSGEGIDRPSQSTVRIGEEVVGIIAVLGQPSEHLTTERRAWLEAAAAAASVATVLSGERPAAGSESAVALLSQLAAGQPADLPAFLARARRLGLPLEAGAAAVSARPLASGPPPRLPSAPHSLLAEVGPGRILGLTAPAAGPQVAEELAAELRDLGMTAAVSAPRPDPAALHEAVREAELLVELAARTPLEQLSGPENTYRLLIGVLLRDPEELARLRERTISPLAEYDARHDTDLLETLKAFLEHDGSTTETADAMQLHRHTVGYRLSRVHEVSGLSPYESDGRERLSLGLKAHSILGALARLDR